MSDKKQLIALDCGNSSYRVVLGTYADNKLSIEVLAQEKNSMVKVKDFYYWDMMKMYKFLISNLKKCIKKGIEPDAIGVCTWGVDFGFFDSEGYLLGDALSYRNEIGQKILDELSDQDKEDMFFQTGILCDRINSVYMMSALQKIMPARTETAKHVLMVPDIFNYYLTGEMINEPSELSTTQLMNAVTKEIDKNACEFFGIPNEWFSEIGKHGEAIGILLKSVKEEIGSTKDIPVICVPSHDTASAVAAIPAKEAEFLFISSGTWALIGVELQEPIINKKVLESGLTNEVGALNKITLLKNSTGMFILERMKTEYEEVAGAIEWSDFLQMTKEPEHYVNESKEKIQKNWSIDVNDKRYFNPLNMTAEIVARGQEVTMNTEFGIGELLYVVQYSMAVNYSKILGKLEKVTGKNYERVYMVGGGTRNKRINEMTAQISGKNVITCGDESTCLGNIGVQLKYFYPEMDLKDIRMIIGKSIEMKTYKASNRDSIRDRSLL